MGAPFDDDGELDIGAHWILFLNTDGTVKGHQKVSQTQGGFMGDLDSGDLFGHVITNMGDLNRDGVNDFTVRVPRDNDGGDKRGAVWIVFSESVQAP